MVIDARGKPDTEKDQQLADLTLAAADKNKAVAAARLRLQAFELDEQWHPERERTPRATEARRPGGAVQPCSWRTVIDDEREDVQAAALDVLLHTVKATCEGLIEAVANSPHVHHDDGDDEGPRVVARLQAVIEEIDGA